jgi:hypothetical protein
VTSNQPEGGEQLNASVIDFAIVGTPRSGTTFVQRVCDEVPGVAAVGETHFYSVAIRRFRAAGLSFPMQPSEVREAMELWAALPLVEGLEVDVDAVVETLGERCDRPAALLAAIVRQLAPAPAAIVGEKTPDHLRHWRRMTRDMPDLKVIWVVRDARDVAPSLCAVPWGDTSIVGAARRWKRDVARLHEARGELATDRLLCLRFEDVVADPDMARQSIATFLGAGSADKAEHPIDVDHHPAGLARDWEWWKHAATESVDDSRASAWQRSADHVALIEQICHRELETLGYPLLFGSLERALRALTDADLWSTAMRSVPRRVRISLDRARSYHRIPGSSREVAGDRAPE